MIGSTDRSVGDWSDTETVRSYGGASDLWGETWTYSQINASTFGVAISVSGPANSGEGANADIDHIAITVHYTTAGGSSVAERSYPRGVGRGLVRGAA